MKISKADVQNLYTKGKEQVRNAYQNHVKPAYQNHVQPKLEKGIKYTRELTHDAVEFAKKNPKTVGAAVGGAVLLGTAIGLIAKAVKKNKARKELANAQFEMITHQRNMINALKDEVASRQFVIDTMNAAAAVQAQKK